MSQHLLASKRTHSLIRNMTRSTFGVHDPLGLRYLFQLRVNLSPLRSHKRQHNFSATLSDICECNLGIGDICECNLGIEDICECNLGIEDICECNLGIEDICECNLGIEDICECNLGIEDICEFNLGIEDICHLLFQCTFYAAQGVTYFAKKQLEPSR